jgi:hypothetical protein
LEYPWEGEDSPGEWIALEHSFRDGHVQTWWALEPTRWPFEAGRHRRLVVATTDPATLPELTTFYLFTNLPAPEPERGAANGDLAPADVAEVSRLYALRSWIEQSYKQVKNSLGWAHYQVRKDLSILRHWQLVCLAFSFCWWACEESTEVGSPPVVLLGDGKRPSSTAEEPRGGKKSTTESPVSWPRALRKVRSWVQPYVMLLRYWRAYTDLPPPKELQRLLERLLDGEGVYLYVH